MGMFSVTCGLTGYPITGGEDVVLFPLVPHVLAQNLTEETFSGSVVSNNGSFAFFRALTLPLFGVYDMYGSCDPITEDDNTKIIENYFGITIREFVDITTMTHNEEYIPPHAQHKDLLVKLCGMYMLKEAYDEFIKQQPGEYSLADANATRIILGWEHVLKLLGFKFIKEDKRNDRFRFVYEHPDIPQLEIKSDGKWARAKYQGENIDVYSPRDLKKILAVHDIELGYNGLDEVTKYHVYFDILQEKLNAIKSTDSRYQRLERYHALNHVPLSLGDYIDRSSDLALYIDTIKQGNSAIRQAFSDFMIISQCMYQCNSIFMPHLSGPQFGAPIAHKIRGQLISKLAARTLKENEDLEI